MWRKTWSLFGPSRFPHTSKQEKTCEWEFRSTHQEWKKNKVWKTCFFFYFFLFWF
uniref:Uncharacterized protein n=1 Tax=viral metagenome TaxID=1070528 RepID=A0A6C0ID66_9ZZZZ